MNREKLDQNYYELDGFTQLLVCKCEECTSILETQNTFHLSANWDPNEAVNELRPYKGNLFGYSYQECPVTFPHNLGSTKWLLTVMPTGDNQ